MQHCFINGRIFTNRTDHPWAEALLSENGRIKAVGSNAAIRERMSKDAKVTDLGGRCVLPGLTDSHCHLIKRGQTLKYVDLTHTRSIHDCRTKIRQALKTCEKGQWLQGFGWNENLWEDMRTPDINDLDDIAPDNPILLTRVCLHSIWVNSCALKIAGIDEISAHPPGGRIEKDPKTGKPTGIIKEAPHLIEAHIPEPSPARLREAALAAQTEVLKYGITCVHSHETLRDHDVLKGLEDENALSLRIFHSFPIKELDRVVERKIFPGQGSDHLWYGHIKLFADGSLGARTAYMQEPYENDTSFGLAFLDADELAENVEASHAKGFGAAIHAIGDKAVSNCLFAIIKSGHKEKRAVKDRIEHIQIFRPEDLDLFLAEGVFASVQPIFLPSDMTLAEKLLGMNRCSRAYAWKTIMDHGIPTVFGSDSPIEPCNPLLGIHAAVNRTRHDNTPENGWFPDQKLTLEACINSFTLMPAILSNRQDLMGSLEPGKFADLTVLSEDIFKIPKDRIKDITSAMTVINGEIVFEAD